MAVGGRDRERDRGREEGRLATHDKIQKRSDHEAALGIIQNILVSHPLFRLAANLTLLAILPLLRRSQRLSGSEVLCEILHDECAFCQDNRLR